MCLAGFYRGFESLSLRQNRNPLFSRDCGFFIVLQGIAGCMEYSYIARGDGEIVRGTAQIYARITHDETRSGVESFPKKNNRAIVRRAI